MQILLYLILLTRLAAKSPITLERSQEAEQGISLRLSQQITESIYGSRHLSAMPLDSVMFMRRLSFVSTHVTPAPYSIGNTDT